MEQEELIQPFNASVYFEKEELVLASQLAEDDTSPKLLRSIMNRLAKQSLLSPVNESGFEERAKLRVKFDFYNSLLIHILEINKRKSQKIRKS